MERDGYEIEPGQDWEVDLFRPEDAEGVVRLFLSVYGEGYPIRTYIDPALLKKENKAGRTISSVARTPRGDIVGHNALFSSAPYQRIYESGAGLVHAGYRGGNGIFTQMAAHGLEMAAKTFGVEAVYGESVCNHLFSQKMVHGLGCITFAVEVDLMPASAYSKEKSATDRVASLLDLKTIKFRPHRVYLPQVYENSLRFIYDGLNDRRDLSRSQETFPAGSQTLLNTRYFDFAQVSRIAVWNTGKDFASVFGEKESQVMRQGARVIQVWLKLSEPWVDKATEILRDKGYFLGGVLPRWFDSDGMLMQKIIGTPHWEDMKILTDRARRIVTIAREDWAEITGGVHGLGYGTMAG
jgi:hypothetical protein